MEELKAPTIAYGERAYPYDWAAQEGIEDIVFAADAAHSTGLAGFLLCLPCGTASKDPNCWLCGEPNTHKRKCSWTGAGSYRSWDEACVPESVS